MAEKWIRENLDVRAGYFEHDAIFWREDLATPIPLFLELFESVIDVAIDENKDVRQAIADNDNGRGYKKLILN